MKGLSYQRTEPNGTVKNYTGLYSNLMEKYNTVIINPIIDSHVWKGICHTNAFNIDEIEIDIPLDGATGKQLIVVNMCL
jgi:hypothetical protein